MRVVFAAPELAAIADLAVAIQRLGHEVAALLPYDASAEGRTRPTRVRIPISVGSKKLSGEILQASGPEKLPCYLVKSSEELPPGSPARGVFDSQIAVEFARRLLPSPDVLHFSGWETALAPAYVRMSHLPFRTVVGLSDLSRQGSFERSAFDLTQLPAGFFAPSGTEFFGRLNFLKGGILLANAFVVDGRSTLTALAREPAAHGLGAVLAEQAHKCAAIRQPADLPVWNPETDPWLARTFSGGDLSGKLACRAALTTIAGTAKKSSGPVVLLDCGSDEFGTGDVPEILDRWLANDGSLIVVTAKGVAPTALEAAAYRFPTRVGIMRQPDEAAMHRAIAGADFQLFPQAPTPDFASAAWRAMRYGTVPLAREHAGRREVFEDGEGLVWFVDSPAALWDTLGLRAAELFRTPDALQAVRERAMRHAAEITEQSIAEDYVVLFRRLGVN